ncbi:hypothetical protein Sjap_006612 [Stephania japonica]|uniref:Uncharacterized GPI-anchored protein At5g19230-like domain-containing protein n=1 Tax=Stephania japonica TaxID=461633 RepID=A0AAP0PL78_9MAGN
MVAGDKLLRRFNYWRTSPQIPTVKYNYGAACVADKIADQLERQHQPCKAISPTAPEAQFSNYTEQLSECQIDVNTIKDGALIMECGSLEVDVVHFNFTKSQFVKYFKNTKYTTANFGAKHDLVVVVLATETPGGKFCKSTSGAQFVPNKVFVGFSAVVVAMFLEGFVGLFY